jgi:preprotein translocase subunit SecY
MARELEHRVFSTIVLLLAARALHYIPLPGLWFGSILAQRDLEVSVVSRYSVAWLGLTPYINASVLVVLWLYFRRVRHGADDRDFRVEFYTLCLTGVIALAQGLGVSLGMEYLRLPNGVVFVPNPGWVFRLSTTLPLVASTYVMVFLAYQIAQRGIGNGVCLLTLVNLLPPFSPAVLEQFTRFDHASGELFLRVLAYLAFLTVVLLALIALTLTRWHVPLHQKHDGNATTSSVSLQFNTIGTVGILFAQILLGHVTSFSGFLGIGTSRTISYGSVGYWLSYGILAMGGTTFWTAWAYDPRWLQILLEKSGYTRAGNRPAFNRTQFDRTLTIVTLVFATAVTLSGILIDRLALGFPLRGGAASSLLGIVAISLDVARQLTVHRQMAAAAMGADKEMTCAQCQGGINNDDAFCPSCGIAYAEDAMCERHPESQARAQCVVCKRRLCEECVVESRGRSLCQGHSEVELIEGWATALTTTTRLEAELYKNRLKNAAIPAFVLSNTMESQYGTLGMYEVHPAPPLLVYRELGRGRIRVMVPAHAFLRAQGLGH